MSFDLSTFERENCLRLIGDGGVGWHDYVIDKAARLESEDPVAHRGLLAEVQAFIEGARMRNSDA